MTTKPVDPKAAHADHRALVRQIADALGRWNDHTRLYGPCADGPACVWCPAEQIANTITGRPQDEPGT